MAAMALHHEQPGRGTAVDVMLAERLGHLPENKCRELERVARILFEEFEDGAGRPLSSEPWQ